MERANVAVLLAAYNGKEWIKQQLDSILKQHDVNITIFISVDKSNDGTYEFCCEYADLEPKLVILKYGERFGGAGRNFYRLLRDVDFSGYDYIAFSDQDDIWFENKIYNAIAQIQKNDVHGYSSNVVAFWENGRKCLIDKAQKQVAFDFLFEAAGPGCTYVFKNELCSNFKKFYLERSDEVEDVILHDWMIYAYARSKNYKWYIDKVPSMLYRQHASNQVGANNSIKSAIKRSKQVLSKWYVNEVIKIACLTGVNEEPVTKYILKGRYSDNFILAFKVNLLRRRLRDKVALFLFCIAGLMRR